MTGEARSAATTEPVTAEWLASMIRNYVEDDDFVKDTAAVVADGMTHDQAAARRHR